MSRNTILWFDLETFGLNPKYDRIAQAAWIRTDMDLKKLEEGKVLYCKLSPDYLPNPESCLITHITPQEANEKGICEADFARKLHKELMVPGTIATGYNNVHFDDEAIRTLLYRNLYDPYEREWGEGRSRWDIINLVRATCDLRPGGLTFTTLNPETNAPSFKLTDLTAENNIEQTGAHDALVDVEATIAMARLIKEKQPQLYRWAFTHRQKRQITEVIDVERHMPFLSTQTAFVSEKGNTHPLLPLFYDPDKPNTLYCFDLLRDIPDTAKGDYKETGIFRLQINRMPFVAPLSTLTPDCEERLGFTKKWVMDRASEAMFQKVLTEDSILEAREPYEKTGNDPDLGLYDSFVTVHDKGVLRSVRDLRPEEKLSAGEHYFDDTKYHKLLWRQVARNWPGALSEKDQKAWKSFCGLRLTAPPVDTALTYDMYSRTVEEKIQSLDTSQTDRNVLLALRDYGQELYDKVLKV